MQNSAAINPGAEPDPKSKDHSRDLSDLRLPKIQRNGRFILLLQILGEYPENSSVPSERLPLSRIAQFVAHSFKRLNGIDSEQYPINQMISSTPLWEEIDELRAEIKKLPGKIERRELKRGPHPGLRRRLLNAEAMVSIYTTAEVLIEAHSGGKPDIYELVLALALQPRLGGVNGEGFLRCISQIQNQLQENRFRSENYDRKRIVPWTRDVKGFLESLSVGRNGVNLPFTVGSLLKEDPSRIYSTAEVLKLAHIHGADHRDQRALSSAIQLYELAGLIRRFPRDGSTSGERNTTFGYAGSFSRKRRWRELKLQILGQFKEQDSVALNNLARSKDSAKPGPASALGSWGGIRKATRELISSGIIYSNRSKLGEVRLKLSPEYEPIVRSWVKLARDAPLDQPVHERLRRLLVKRFEPQSFQIEKEPTAAGAKLTIESSWQPLSGSRFSIVSRLPQYDQSLSLLCEAFESELVMKIHGSLDRRIFLSAVGESISQVWNEQLRVAESASLMVRYQSDLKRPRTGTSISVSILPNDPEPGLTLRDMRPGHKKSLSIEGAWPEVGAALNAIAIELKWHIEIDVKKLKDDRKLGRVVCDALKLALERVPKP